MTAAYLTPAGHSDLRDDHRVHRELRRVGVNLDVALLNSAASRLSNSEMRPIPLRHYRVALKPHGVELRYKVPLSPVNAVPVKVAVNVPVQVPIGGITMFTPMTDPVDMPEIPVGDMGPMGHGIWTPFIAGQRGLSPEPSSKAAALTLVVV